MAAVSVAVTTKERKNPTAVFLANDNRRKGEELFLRCPIPVTSPCYTVEGFVGHRDRRLRLYAVEVRYTAICVSTSDTLGED